MNFEENIEVGKVLKKLRASSGLTQSQVAEMLGRPQSYVSKTENGERSLQLVEVFRYSTVLDSDWEMVVSEVRLALDDKNML